MVTIIFGISQIMQLVTSALIVTRLAVPIRRVMGCARLAAVVGYAWIPVSQNLYHDSSSARARQCP